MIDLSPSVLDGLQGINVGDEIVVVTWLHEARRDILKVHPRGDESVPLAGVFATRSPDRPNPLSAAAKNGSEDERFPGRQDAPSGPRLWSEG